MNNIGEWPTDWCESIYVAINKKGGEKKCTAITE